jgi:transketolase
VRTAFVEELTAVAREDPRVVLLTGDLGFNVLEPFIEAFPDRFFNVGVAEQNMLGLATGLAEAGFTPFAYSIATFASMRAYEFFRNGAVVHDLPVRLVGVGAGVDYAHNGVSHFALEDVALMRAQPNVAVLTPADREQTREAVRLTSDLPGPVYLRLGKDAGLREHPGPLRLGRTNVVGSGRDVGLVALGSMAENALAAATLLGQRGIESSTCIVSCVAPPPIDDLVAFLAEVPSVVTVEAHYRAGGLGSLVAEVIAEEHLPCRLERRAVDHVPAGLTGTVESLHRILGLDAASIAEACATLVDHATSRKHG